MNRGGGVGIVGVIVIVLAPIEVTAAPDGMPGADSPEPITMPLGIVTPVITFDP